MNFYKQQETSRRWSLIFSLAFSVAMIACFLLIYQITRILFQTTRSLDLPLTISVSLFVVFLGASIWRIWMIYREGSTFTATALGGIPVNLDSPLGTHDFLNETKLKNVVAEIAVAASLPEPDLYVMPLEPGINALTTGLTYDDAAIIVTWGALKHLTRDELSGLVAHEFSHILNGDMKHNTIMAGWLYGLFVLTTLGRKLIAPRGYGKIGVPIFFAALLSIVLGWLTSCVGRLLLAAFCRHREYLADASAVQFTRNAKDLAGVLKKIGGLQGGSHIKTPKVTGYQHFFLAKTNKVNLLSSHPPLASRIWALDPGWDGYYYDFEAERTLSEESQKSNKLTSGA